MAKGLSLEEKRKRMMDFFHEKKTVHTLKEVEKECIKRGITSQTVEEVLQGVIGDNLVTCEKIGSSNYYWSFPNEETTRVKNQIELLKSKKEKDAVRKQELDAQIKELLEKDTDAKLRESLLREIEAEELKNKKLAQEYEVCKENDPEAHSKRLKLVQQYADEKETWTDNIHITLKWLANKTSTKVSQLQKSFKIPDDL